MSNDEYEAEIIDDDKYKADPGDIPDPEDESFNDQNINGQDLIAAIDLILTKGQPFLKELNKLLRR